MKTVLNATWYLWKIYKEIPGSFIQKKRILSQVITSVRDFATNHPNVSYDDIVARIGAPQQIATACVEDMDAPELLRNLKIRKKIVNIIAASAVVMVLLWGAVMGITLYEYYNNANGYFGREVVVVERETLDKGGN